jgi:hypothetical protein
LEKAFAKYYKSYENIQKGLLGTTLTALTGAPCIYVNTKSTEIMDADIAW